MFRKLSLLVVFLSGLAFSGTAWADGCQKSLETLQKLSSDLQDENITSLQAREGLITLAVLDHKILSSSLFAAVVSQSHILLRTDSPDENWGVEELKQLQAKMNELAPKRKGALDKSKAERAKLYHDREDDLLIPQLLSSFLTGRRAAPRPQRTESEEAIRSKIRKFDDQYAELDEEIAKTYNKAQAIEAQRKSNAQLRERIRKQDPTSYAHIPSVTKVELARKIWQNFITLYELPENFDSLTLAQIKSISDQALSYGLTLDDLKIGNRVIKEIQKDPVLTDTMAIVISDLMADIQEDVGIVENPKTFLKKAKDLVIKNEASRKLFIDPQIESFSAADNFVTFARVSPFTKERETTQVLPLVNLVSDEYPLLFSDSYFEIFENTFNPKWLSLKKLTAEFPNYTSVAKREIAQKVWDNLKRTFITHPEQFIGPFDLGLEISRTSAKNNTSPGRKYSPDVVAQNSYLIRAIEQNPEMLNATLQLIENNLIETAELIPRLKNADVWKYRLGRAVGITATTVGGGLGVVTMWNALHSGLGTTHVLLSAAGHGVGGLGLGSATASGGVSLSNKFFDSKKTKLVNTLKDHATTRTANEDEGE